MGRDGRVIGLNGRESESAELWRVPAAKAMEQGANVCAGWYLYLSLELYGWHARERLVVAEDAGTIERANEY